MYRCFVIVLFWLGLLTSCNKATFSTNENKVFSRVSGGAFENILGERIYKHHIVTTYLDVDWRDFFRWLKDTIRSYTGDTGLKTRGYFLQRWLPKSTPFLCRKINQRSATVPHSVHQLRPGDIDIIAAMGDSITAGTGANAESIPENFIESRGLSFSIGGQGNFRTHLTLPNILKEFNPRLFGYAWGDAFSKDRAAQFNTGENAAVTSDMPFLAYNLLRRMRLDRRTFVNLVIEPAVSLILSMDGLSVPWNCHLGRHLECYCLEGPLYSHNRKVYKILERSYRSLFNRVAHRAEFQRNDFAVVAQPFGLNATVYINDFIRDTSIMSYDCIHWTQKGHAVMANALWNNMMQSENNKTIGIKPLWREFECPTEDNPYLKTYLNS